MMFKDVMSNGIRQVIVVANNALTRDVLVQNAMNIQDSWGETREAYVSFMRKYSGIAFVPKFAVDSKETRGKVPYMDIVNGLAKVFFALERKGGKHYERNWTYPA